MKKIIAILIAVNVILGIIIAGLFYLSETYPFRPGEKFFGFQNTAEQKYELI